MNDNNETKEFTFNGQRQGERVKTIVKNHPIVLVWPIVKMLLYIAAAVFIFIKFNYEVIGIISFVLVLLGIAELSRAFYVYKESVLLITNHRVINVGQEGFIKRKITETELEKIQDIASETKGLFRMLFKYGDLIIRTAGSSEGKEIVVKNIAHPYDIQQVVVNAKHS